ncbi:hypothetical protein Tco_0916429, partial [Tanacetum coccineum]
MVNSYNIDKDLFLVYGKDISLKRGHEDKDKDKDPPVGSDQRMKRRKTSKDVESSKGLKSKESKLTSSYKGTTRSQPKSSGKSAQAKDPIHKVDDTEVQQNQGQDMGNTDDQPNVEAALKDLEAAFEYPVLFRPMGYSISYDSKEEPIEEDPLEEPNEE